MHFSAWEVSALHMEPSAGLILTMRCRFFMPIPQVALHSSHSPHSVIRQLLGAGRPALLGSRLPPGEHPLLLPYPLLARHSPPPPRPYSQHSSLTVHFSVSSVGSVHTEPSSGNCFTYLSRDRMPRPQEMLQGDQVIHSDMVQVEPSATHDQARLQPGCPALQGGNHKGTGRLFPSAYFCLFRQRLTDNIIMNLFLGFLSCSTEL